VDFTSCRFKPHYTVLCLMNMSLALAENLLKRVQSLQCHPWPWFMAGEGSGGRIPASLLAGNKGKVGEEHE
jgi:hypothetical protein